MWALDGNVGSRSGEELPELPPPCAPSELSQTLHTELCHGAGAATEAVPPSGYTFPGGRVQDWCTWTPGMDLPAPLPLAVSQVWGRAALCPPVPKAWFSCSPSELGLGFIQLGLVLLEWKSALVCQPSPEVADPHWQLLLGATRGKVLGQAPGILLCPSWYADPARTIPVPAGVWSLLPVPQHHHHAQLCTPGTKISAVQPEPPSLARCLHEESLAVPPAR